MDEFTFDNDFNYQKHLSALQNLNLDDRHYLKKKLDLTED